MRITILYLSLQNKLSANICFYSAQNQKAARGKCLPSLKKSIEVCVEVYILKLKLIRLKFEYFYDVSFV